MVPRQEQERDVVREVDPAWDEAQLLDVSARDRREMREVDRILPMLAGAVEEASKAERFLHRFGHVLVL